MTHTIVVQKIQVGKGFLACTTQQALTSLTPSECPATPQLIYKEMHITVF